MARINELRPPPARAASLPGRGLGRALSFAGPRRTNVNGTSDHPDGCQNGELHIESKQQHQQHQEHQPTHGLGRAMRRRATDGLIGLKPQQPNQQQQQSNQQQSNQHRPNNLFGSFRRQSNDSNSTKSWQHQLQQLQLDDHDQDDNLVSDFQEVFQELKSVHPHASMGALRHKTMQKIAELKAQRELEDKMVKEKEREEEEQRRKCINANKPFNKLVCKIRNNVANHNNAHHNNQEGEGHHQEEHSQHTQHHHYHREQQHRNNGSSFLDDSFVSDDGDEKNRHIAVFAQMMPSNMPGSGVVRRSFNIPSTAFQTMARRASLDNHMHSFGANNTKDDSDNHHNYNHIASPNNDNHNNHHNNNNHSSSNHNNSNQIFIAKQTLYINSSSKSQGANFAPRKSVGDFVAMQANYLDASGRSSQDEKSCASNHSTLSDMSGFYFDHREGGGGGGDMGGQSHGRGGHVVRGQQNKIGNDHDNENDNYNVHDAISTLDLEQENTFEKDDVNNRLVEDQGQGQVNDEHKGKNAAKEESSCYETAVIPLGNCLQTQKGTSTNTAATIPSCYGLNDTMHSYLSDFTANTTESSSGLIVGFVDKTKRGEQMLMDEQGWHIKAGGDDSKDGHDDGDIKDDETPPGGFVADFSAWDNKG